MSQKGTVPLVKPSQGRPSLRTPGVQKTSARFIQQQRVGQGPRVRPDSRCVANYCGLCIPYLRRYVVLQTPINLPGTDLPALFVHSIMVSTSNNKVMVLKARNPRRRRYGRRRCHPPSSPFPARVTSRHVAKKYEEAPEGEEKAKGQAWVNMWIVPAHISANINQPRVSHGAYSSCSTRCAPEHGFA